MKVNDIVSKAKSAKAGTIHTITLNKTIKLKNGGFAQKVSKFQGQVHVPYGRTKKVREQVENGERQEPTLPPWADQVVIDGVRLWQHKNTKKLYLPIRPTGNKPKSDFFVNGALVRASELVDLLYAKDKKKNKPSYVGIDLDNIEEFK